MSWSIEEHIGECRPFPAQVIVYKGETDESMAYVSGEVADKLKDENEHLRELSKFHYECSEFYRDERDKLKAENAKLRELVRDMLRNMHGCTYHHSCGACDFDECIYEARAHELGIEED